MKIVINDDKVLGKGSKLYGVTIIDDDDVEQTSLNLWRANDEDDLESQLKDYYIGDRSDYKDAVDEDSDDDLPNEDDDFDEVENWDFMEDSDSSDEKESGWEAINRQWDEDYGFKILTEELGKIID